MDYTKRTYHAKREEFLKGITKDPISDTSDANDKELKTALYCNTQASANDFKTNLSAVCSSISRAPSSNKYSVASLSSSRTDRLLGLCELPNQIYRKAVSNGFEFNLLVLGRSFQGKKTFINSLFSTNIYEKEEVSSIKKQVKDVASRTISANISEDRISLRLNVTDFPGFGDFENNSNCYDPVVSFLDARFQAHLSRERKVYRSRTAVNPNMLYHACIYFITRLGKGLSELDINCMQKINEKVNLIPVIAKADSFTDEECKEFKKAILSDFQAYKIKTYDFPDHGGVASAQSEVSYGDEELPDIRKLKQRAPFALVCSSSTLVKNGKEIRARTYPWGTVEVDSLEHNDFSALKRLLLCTHMQDLKDVTLGVHYENYRSNYLSSIVANDGVVEREARDPIAQLEAEKRVFDEKLQKKQSEMEKVFEQKLQEKVKKINQMEEELVNRKERQEREIEAQLLKVEERFKILEGEKTDWNAVNKEWENNLDFRISSERLDGAKEKSKTKKKGLF